MRDVLEYIEIQENKFSQLGFFRFLTDSKIDYEQRLSWFYYIAQLAMSFKDLNNNILNIELNDYTFQTMVNSYLVENGSYWKEYLNYLETLEIDQVIQSSVSLKFMWSDKTLKTRRLANNLMATCRYEADFLLKIVIITAIEAAGSPALSAIAQVSEELQTITHNSNVYFSHKVLKFESESFLLNIELNPEQKAQALVLVDYVFDKFTEYANGLMQLTQHNCQALPTQARYALC
jgi:hypothetical protein